MRILVINKYVPPEPAPTAVLVAGLTAMLEAKGAEVIHLGAHVGYRGMRPTGWRRWVHEVRLLLRLLWTGLSSRRTNCIICLSDPPGVLFVAALLARLKRTALVHWAMDVYPDTAAALGEIRSGSLVHQLAGSAMSFGYGTCDLIACLDTDMLQQLRLEGDPRAFVSTPWPPSNLILPDKPTVPGGGRIRWMYSGNLGRAHEYETLLRAQKLLESADQPFELVFQGGGNAWAAAKALACELGLQHCHWENYAPQEELVPSLLRAHALIATQRNEVKGLLWPSKLALLKLLPRPIVWIGPLDGAIAQDLSASGDLHGLFAIGDSHGLANWLSKHAESLRKASTVTISQDTLMRASVSVIEGEKNVWWSRLAHILLPEASCRAAPVKQPFPGNPS